MAGEVILSDAERLVRRLQSVDIQAEQESQAVIRQIFAFCHHTQPRFQDRATECAELGAVRELFRIAFDQVSERTRSCALQTLGAMCFYNTFVSAMVCDEMLAVNIETKMANPEMCYLLNNVAAYSWSHHSKILNLVPHAIAIFKDEKKRREHRAWCVRFLGQLAYNENNRQALLETQCLDVLVMAMVSADVELACCTAALGLGCLVGDQPNHPALTAAQHTHLVRMLVEAFEASIHSRDYPAGSNVYYSVWKLSMGLKNLALAAVNRTKLIECGMIGLLRDAIETTNNATQVEHSLPVLWELCLPE